MESMETGRGMMKIEAGDVLQRQKGVVTHMGIALSGGKVFHNTPERGEHVSSLDEFSQGKTVTIVKKSNKDRQKSLERVRIALDHPQKYEVLSNNCEHTVNKITKGRGTSPQLFFGLLVLGIASFIVLND